MHRTDASHGSAVPGSSPTRARRTSLRRTATTVLTALLTGAATLTTLAVAGTTPAGASTLNGIATIDSPGTSTFLAGGGSNTEFTVSLPLASACDGDTATHGYHVYSYLVQKGTNLSTVTFNGSPSTGYGFVDVTGEYYGPINTAVGTGQVLTLPNDFQWAPLVTQDGLLSTLTDGGTTGVWEAGIACATTTGALADNWNTEVTFTASTTDPNGFTWSAVPGPSGSTPAAITSGASTTFTTGEANSFTVTDSGSPTPTLSESGALPAGVTFNATTGVLSGTPTASGTFPLTFTATNGIESAATQHFSLTVQAGVAPTITSAASTSFTEGSPGTFTVTATGTPAPTLSETGTLPAGVTFNATTGVLSGTPTEVGSYPVTLTATNGVGGPATQSFTLKVVAAPSITSANSTTFVEGVSGSFTVTATGYPAPTFSATGLPTGVSINPTTGVLSGTATATGTSTVTLTATNGVGSPATQSFTLKVVAIEITTTSLPTATVGAAYNATLAELGGKAPYKWTASPKLPKGLKLDKTTGVISGSVSSKVAPGTYTVTVTLSDKSKPKNTTTATLSITVVA